MSATPRTHVIILAAGKGSRFGTHQAKCLHPVFLGQGTLVRLLQRLTTQCQITGHILVMSHPQHHEAMARVTAAWAPQAFCHPVNACSGPFSPSLLHSLGQALTHPAVQGGDAWVFFADTDYPVMALHQCLAIPVGLAAIAAVPRGTTADLAIGLLSDSQGDLCAIGPQFTQTSHVLAPALRWPQALWPHIHQAAQAGHHSQWQVWQTLLPHTRPRTLTLPAGSLLDVDTPTDLEALRMRLAPHASLQYFNAYLDKDARSRYQPDQQTGAHFLKHCVSAEAAQHEFRILQWLHEQPGEVLVPAAVAVKDKCLVLQAVSGIRLYDLLRLLATLPTPTSTKAAQILLARAQSRLAQLQQALQAWPNTANLPPYPLQSHVIDLLACLLHWLEQAPLSANTRHELRQIQQLWEADDARLPFRDATPKNIIVALPHLAPTIPFEERKRRVNTWIQSEEAVSQAPLLDIDFTATQHLTAPEDDWISLMGHQGSLQHLPNGLAQLPLQGPRAARALLVRYLRFGGRKLAYRLLNPTGYAIRFRYDDPAVYFQQLVQQLPRIDPEFSHQWPGLWATLITVQRAVGNLPPWDPQETEHDLWLNHQPHQPRYWQESPLELTHAAS